jgi:hypothetical protein
MRQKNKMEAKNETIKFYFWQGTIKGEMLIYCNLIGENFEFLTPIGENCEGTPKMLRNEAIYQNGAKSEANASKMRQSGNL